MKRLSSRQKPTVAIFGLGYVGLTLGTVMADKGFTVLGIEPRPRSIEALRRGEVIIHENGLPELLRKHANRRLRFFESPDNVKADVYIVAVGTPVGDGKKEPDLGYVRAVAGTLGKLVKKGDLIVLRSTVPVGTTRNVVLPIVEQGTGLKAGKDFFIVFAPERMAEGAAIQELTKIPQIIGGVSPKCVEKAAAVFRHLVPKIIPVSSLEGAELVKLFNNTYRDVTFGFANEVALICDDYNIDPKEVISAANEDYPRSRIPLPSPGVGGYCLTKDPFILLHSTKKLPYRPSIVFSARQVNDVMPRHVAHKVIHFLTYEANRKAADAKVFVMGFAFKGHPETSDIRFSPTLDVMRYLTEAGIMVAGHDPLVEAGLIRDAGATPVATLREGFSGADCAILMTNHRSYAAPSVLRAAEKMRRPSLFFDPWELHAAKSFSPAKGRFYCNLGFTNAPA